MGIILFYAIFIIAFLLSLYSLLNVLLIRKLHTGGTETKAAVISVDYTVAIGLRRFFLANFQKGDREYSVACDYIATLEYTPQDGEKIRKQFTIPARFKQKNGIQMPYIRSGDVIPVRYSPIRPRMAVAAMDEVAKRQMRPFSLIAWSFCTILLAALLIVYPFLR